VDSGALHGDDLSHDSRIRERGFFEVEQEGKKDSTPSMSWDEKLLGRILDEGFVVCLAEPLEADRCQVTREHLNTHFDVLSASGIADCDPTLVINIREIGFGPSQSGLPKSKRVIVPKEFEGTQKYQAELESHFVTALTAISLAGDLLMPALITKRNNDACDALSCSFHGHVKRYRSDSEFVIRSIFSNYLRDVILVHIQERRQTLNDNSARAFVVFGGRRAHVSDLINSMGYVVFASATQQPLDAALGAWVFQEAQG
jgi:hypothetical protein